ncbi:MAG: ABC transporter ATP-binding protein, partial [Candidatus Dormibacteraeota bacterium]|nr:ABC transporter ATP-binding protein [Candidatus Dormibacteraeota bacterium]
KGQIVAEGTPQALKAAVSDVTVVEIEAYGVAEPVLAAMRALDGVDSVTMEARDQAQMVLVQAREASLLTGRLLQLLEGVRVERIGTREPTLEDAYVALVTAG